MTTGTTRVGETDFLDARDSYRGWCTECLDFTRDCTEPDAHGYRCPDCSGMTVMGAENALISGAIAVDCAS